MLSLVIAESSIEIVPNELRGHPAVIASAKKLGKNTSDLLLDNSWHFAAMKGVKNENKRGRPDLLHFCLLEACSIPLYFEKRIKIYVHTIENKVIFIDENVRLPKSFHRFSGLIEKLYREKNIMVENKKLLELKEMRFSQLIEFINPKKVVALSTEGESSTYQNVASKLNSDTCLVVGGFQKSHFSQAIKNKINQSFKVEDRSLEAHVVLSRILYEYEKTVFM